MPHSPDAYHLNQTTVVRRAAHEHATGPAAKAAPWCAFAGSCLRSGGGGSTGSGQAQPRSPRRHGIVIDPDVDAFVVQAREGADPPLPAGLAMASPPTKAQQHKAVPDTGTGLDPGAAALLTQRGVPGAAGQAGYPPHATYPLSSSKAVGAATQGADAGPQGGAVAADARVTTGDADAAAAGAGISAAGGLAMSECSGSQAQRDVWLPDRFAPQHSPLQQTHCRLVRSHCALVLLLLLVQVLWQMPELWRRWWLRGLERSLLVSAARPRSTATCTWCRRA
jgi:hypothetical protein